MSSFNPEDAGCACHGTKDDHARNKSCGVEKSRDALDEALSRLGKSIRTNSEREGFSRYQPAGDQLASVAGEGGEIAHCFYDIGARDSRSMMDVAVFRLSKRYKRAGEIIFHRLPDGYVEVRAGPGGMASIWDYDIVLMMISNLTEAMNRFRAGKGKMPSPVVRPFVSDILRFCRRGDGSRQVEEIEAALDRLQGMAIKTSRKKFHSNPRFPDREINAFGLVNSYKIISRTDTGRVNVVEIEAPRWIYEQVTKGKSPDVLALHPSYFHIESGIGRFIYRLARRAAGRDEAKWAFATIYQRSGSSGTLKEFARALRRIIKDNNLPDYVLREETGRSGPQLCMNFRGIHSQACAGQD